MKKFTILEKVLGIILTLILIATGLITIIDRIPFPNPKPADNSGLIEMTLKPEFINEGVHKEIQLEINVPDLDKQNITYLTLSKNNIKVDRLNKNDQTEVATQIYWENTFSGYDWVFNYQSGTQYPSRTELNAKGKLYCPTNNCFFGKNSPYQLTFTIHYRIGEGSEIPITIKKELPIK